jgi:osomolarity two-component system response regulator SKN7
MLLYVHWANDDLSSIVALKNFTNPFQPDGVIAVTKVTNAPEYFDLIFMDIIMPGLDGASATELIRQAAPTIPVIAMTSNIKPEDVQWYADHGQYMYCRSVIQGVILTQN